MKTQKLLAWIHFGFSLIIWLCFLPCALTLPRTLFLVLSTGVTLWWVLFFVQLVLAVLSLVSTFQVFIYGLVCLGQFDKAEQLVQGTWIKFFRQEKQLRWMLASAFCNEGQYDRADGLIDSLLVKPVRTQSANAWLTKALICIAQGDLEQAESIVQEVNVWRNQNPLHRSIGKPFSVGDMASRFKSIESSDVAFRNRLCKGVVIFFVFFGVIAAKYFSDYRETLSVLVYPSAHDLYIAEASLLAERKEFDKALSYLDKAATSDSPLNYWDYHNRASIYHSTKRYPDEIEILKKAIDLAPKPEERLVGLRMSLVSAYIDSGKYDTAMADLNALSDMTDHDRVCLRKAIVYLAIGDGAKACELSQQVENGFGKYFMKAKLMGYFGCRLEHQDQKAKAVLSEAEKECWHSQSLCQIVRYLIHEIDENQLLLQANGDRELIEAHAYIGLQQAMSGESDKARRNFQWVVDKGDTSAEFDISAAWLRRLTKTANIKADPFVRS